MTKNEVAEMINKLQRMQSISLGAAARAERARYDAEQANKALAEVNRQMEEILSTLSNHWKSVK